MGFFERFKPFIYFGQFVGLFPYRIETDGKYKRFTFCWCHPLTIWFVLSLVLQFSPMINSIFIIINANKIVASTATERPTSLLIVTGIAIMSHYAMVLISRSVTLRYNQLRLAVESISVKIIKELEEFETFPRCQNSTKKRTFIGIFLIFITVI